MADPHLSTLPVTFRPRLGRWVPCVLAVAVLVGFGVVAVTLTSEGAAGAKALDRTLLVLFALAVAFALYRFGSVRVRADGAGLLVRNLVRSRSLSWAEVVVVRMAPGDPWVYLELADGSTLAAMGIQGSDGEYGRARASALAALVAERSTPEG